MTSHDSPAAVRPTPADSPADEAADAPRLLLVQRISGVTTLPLRVTGRVLENLRDRRTA